MILSVKVGTMPARALYVKGKRKPSVGDEIEVVDKSRHGSKPQRAVVREIKVHVLAGDIYCVELV